MSALSPINIRNVQARATPLDPIILSAAPGTDFWRKPPSTDSSNAPALIEYNPIAAFQSASVTFNATWDRLYDQGGLILVIGSDTYEAWVKTGIEVFDGKSQVATVATPPQGYSDWSLTPAAPRATSQTTEIAREVNGTSLFVYNVEGKKKTLIREITWVFNGAETSKKLLGVGVYAARPTKVDGEGKGKPLKVQFDGLEIKWKKT